MNLFLFEVKSYIRSTVSWMGVIIILFLLFMLGMFPQYMNAENEIRNVLESFPAFFTLMFGIVISQMFSFEGFYNFVYLYISVIAGAMAASMGITIFAREKRAKCMDFLLTKPISRIKVFFSKLLASLVLIVGSNILFLIVFIAVYQKNGSGESSIGRVLYTGLGVLFTQLVFLTMGIVVAGLMKRIRSVAGIATVFAIGGFILSSLANVIDEEKMSFIAPLKYFEPYGVFAGEGYDGKLVVMAILIIIICLGIAFIKFTKSDTRQV